MVLYIVYRYVYSFCLKSIGMSIVLSIVYRYVYSFVYSL